MKNRSHWRATIASGAITIMALTITASVLSQFVGDFWPFGDEPEASESASEGVSVANSLQERNFVITDEAEFIPEVACSKENRSEFESRKQEGLTFRVASNYERAEALFQIAFDLCAAPEALIARNNAGIGDEPAHVLVFSVPFSGNNPNNAVEMLRGAAQAQTEINEAGGIDGVPLKLIVVDDADQEERAREIAIAITDDPEYSGVLGVVGHWTSDVSLSAAAIYRDRQTTPFMTPISTTKELTGYSPWVYRATINNRSGAEAMARHMLDDWQLNKAAIFYVEAVTYSEEIRSEFKSIIDAGRNGKIVAEFDMAASDFDAEEAVEEALAAGAEAILLATNNGSVPQALAVMKENVGRMKMLGDLANLYTPKTLTEIGNAAEGLTLAIAWDIEGSVNEAYKRDSQSLWRGPVNYVSAMSYSALKAMAAAIEKASDQASDQVPTRALVQQALSSEAFEAQGAPAQPIQFDRGDLQTPVQLVEVVKASGGQPALDFKPVGE